MNIVSLEALGSGRHVSLELQGLKPVNFSQPWRYG
jgi:hypothetical protein